MLMLWPKIVVLQETTPRHINQSQANTTCGRANLMPLTVAKSSSRLIVVGVATHQASIREGTRPLTGPEQIERLNGQLISQQTRRKTGTGNKRREAHSHKTLLAVS